MVAGGRSATQTTGSWIRFVRTQKGCHMPKVSSILWHPLRVRETISIHFRRSPRRFDSPATIFQPSGLRVKSLASP